MRFKWCVKRSAALPGRNAWGDVFRWLPEIATGYPPVAPPALKEKAHVLNRPWSKFFKGNPNLTFRTKGETLIVHGF